MKLIVLDATCAVLTTFALNYFTGVISAILFFSGWFFIYGFLASRLTTK